jgi:hypothetical protein
MVTSIAFSPASEAAIRAWAERDSGGTVLERYVLGIAPEGGGDGGEVVGAVPGEVGAFGEVLAQQPVGVLVGGALPRALRVAEVDL